MASLFIINKDRGCHKNYFGIVLFYLITVDIISGLDSQNVQNDPYDKDVRHKDEKQADIDFTRRVHSSPHPSLALVPNECSMSRSKALERSLKKPDIWIPECEPEKEKLYAEKQCHKSKVCWCVDPVNGLPLRSRELLSKQASINCTEIKSLIGGPINPRANSSSQSNQLFYQGFSEFCDSDKRYEFVFSLIDQFRYQLAEHLRNNPINYTTGGININNLNRPVDVQTVAKWKFHLIDSDSSGLLEDREWTKFKMNFRLVDHSEDSHKSFSSVNQSVNALNILRGQRRCWRDFLEFCGSGELLIDNPITMTKWLSCTGLPPRASSDPITSSRREGEMSSEIYAYSQAAAIKRSKEKNPFLGILKPD